MATHHEIEELLGAYALDAVDEDERALVDAHLAECPRCAAEVAEHREVAAMMAYSGASAPDGVWTRIVDSLEEPPPAIDLTSRVRGVRVAEPPVEDELARRRDRRGPRAVLGAAAAALVIGLFGGVLAANIGDDDSNTPPIEVAEPTLEELARRALNDPDAAKVTLASAEDQALTAAAALRADGSGYLLGTSLPPLDREFTYQLWGVRGDLVVSLGVLGHSPGVIAFQASPGTEALVITLEQAPGVATSSNPALLVGEVS